MSRETENSQSYAIFFRHSAVLSLPAVLLRKVPNRRFHGRGRHLVGRAKNSDGLGRVIVSVQNGGERIQVRRLFTLNRYVPTRFPLFASSQ